jgi:hypothetical protein
MTDGGPTSSRRQRGRHSERSRVSLLKPAAPAVPAAADKQHNDNYDDEKRGGYPYPCRTPPGGALRVWYFACVLALQPTLFDLYSSCEMLGAGPLYYLPRYSIGHAAVLTSLSAPRMTILSASSGPLHRLRLILGHASRGSLLHRLSEYQTSPSGKYRL